MYLMLRRKNLFIHHQKKVAKPEPKVQKIVEKKVEEKVVKPVVKKTTSTKTNSTTTKPKGTFVQVGAFSKMPSDKYLNNITKKRF